jgi:hypothetical protein
VLHAEGGMVVGKRHLRGLLALNLRLDGRLGEIHREPACIVAPCFAFTVSPAGPIASVELGLMVL